MTVRGQAGRMAYLLRHTRCFRRPCSGGLAAVGDSITVGGGSPLYGFLVDDSWVTHLVRRGRVPYGFNGAVRGQITEHMADGLGPVLERRPEVAVILSGTNDDQADQTIEHIARAAAALRSAGARTVLATIPPLGAWPAHVGAVNLGVRDLAASIFSPIIDFHAVLADGSGFKPGLSEDGMHPNARASRLMADVAEPVILETFG